MDKKFILILVYFLIPLILAAHPLPTDFSNETTGLLEGMADWSYQVSQGTFWVFMLLGFCFVLFVATKRYTTDRAFGFAGVTGLFGSIFLAVLGLMTWTIATFFIIAGAISVVAMILARSNK